MEFRMIYITTKNKEEARTIGQELVKNRLAACVNIIETMSSIYWWQGQIQDDQEAILIAKTTEEKAPALIDKVISLHSYEVPCVLALPILSGNQEFLSWIEKETQSTQ